MNLNRSIKNLEKQLAGLKCKLQQTKRSPSQTSTQKECRRHNPCEIGSYREVFHGSAIMTPNGLRQNDIIQNKRGRLVSKKKHLSGLKIYKRKDIQKIFKKNRAEKWKKKVSVRTEGTVKHKHRIGYEVRGKSKTIKRRSKSPSPVKQKRCPRKHKRISGKCVKVKPTHTYFE